MDTVLVVDDDDCFQFLCEVVLRKVNQSVKILRAFDGQEALDTLAEQNELPDLVLLDINMPRMDGHEFLEKYGEQSPGELPVVAMLTSSELPQDRRSALQYDFVKEYLIKPPSREDVKRLSRLIEEIRVANV